jgi:hypothetical protein
LNSYPLRFTVFDGDSLATTAAVNAAAAAAAGYELLSFEVYCV